MCHDNGVENFGHAHEYRQGETFVAASVEAFGECADQGRARFDVLDQASNCDADITLIDFCTFVAVIEQYGQFEKTSLVYTLGSNSNPPQKIDGFLTFEDSAYSGANGRRART